MYAMCARGAHALGAAARGVPARSHTRIPGRYAAITRTGSTMALNPANCRRRWSW